MSVAEALSSHYREGRCRRLDVRREGVRRINAWGVTASLGYGALSGLVGSPEGA